MLTTDKFLIKLIDSEILETISSIPKKDKKILISLRLQLKRQYFFTEKQGKLLVKLLEFNKQFLKNLDNEELKVIDNPCWSEEFRHINPVRRIYFSNEKKDNITIEFTHDKDIKKKLAQEFTLLGTRKLISSTSSKFVIHSNEYNIITLLDILYNENFEIQSDILEVYNLIKNTIDKHKDYIHINNPKNSKLLNLVTSDLQDTDNRDLLLLDRKIKFQYDYTPETVENTLEYQIANRKNINVFIKESLYSLDQIFFALQTLKRFPVLIVFDQHNVESCNKTIDALYNLLNQHKNTKKVGIYFRFDNDDNKEFNQKIANYKFNSYLDSETEIVGLSIKQLPKFIIKSSWKPESIITNMTNFRSNKFFAYFNNVDLIIMHSLSEPLAGKHHVIL